MAFSFWKQLEKIVSGNEPSANVTPPREPNRARSPTFTPTHRRSVSDLPGTQNPDSNIVDTITQMGNSFGEKVASLFDFWKTKEQQSTMEATRRMSFSTPHSPHLSPHQTKPRSSTIYERPVSPQFSSPTKPPVQRNWRKDTKNIWMKPLQQLPVCTDLPRLVHFITVEKCNGKDIEEGNGPVGPQGDQKSQTELVWNILEKLAAFLEGETSVDKLKEQYYKYVTGDDSQTGGFAKQLFRLLSEVLGEDSKIVKVLKVCHQSIIAPSVIELRLSVCPNLPFKDAGGWRIHVYVLSDSVVVTHRKKQKHRDASKKEEQFEFEWMLKMVFSLDMSNLTDCSLVVSKLTFEETTTEQKKQEISSMFSAYIQQ